jgi:phage major head subunit gpT-like protein
MPARGPWRLPSTGSDETYGWLGQFPQLRDWIGPRHVRNLKAHKFTIANRKFESTVAIQRDNISDDKLGIFKPSVSEMGHPGA